MDMGLKSVNEVHDGWTDPSLAFYDRYIMYAHRLISGAGRGTFTDRNESI